MMTELEYLAEKGRKCPYCGSHDITATEGIYFDGAEGVCHVVCDTCHKKWQDFYALVSVVFDEE